ncbi:ABC transporter substrate-binding protein, partial [Pseudorhodoplanes sp.]|uniref:ABC transporter substrate-binding protein n=1 Tax=Pseudorhodoplanes sp. TaxID=1934341 RepID=UPI003D11B293
MGMVINRLRFLILTLSCLFVAAPVAAQTNEVKVGVIGIFSGPYASWGNEYRQGVELYLDQHNGKNGNPKVTVLFRDVGGDNPARARQLAQELIVRDKVTLLGGLEFTPNVLALADLITEAKVPFIAFGSATAFITDKSPYYIRAAYTQWTVQTILGKWAISQGMKRCAILAADFATGHDSIAAFTHGYTGGTVAEVVRVPLGTTDISSYLQRVQDANPQSLDVFLPLGPMSVAFFKAFA